MSDRRIINEKFVPLRPRVNFDQEKSIYVPILRITTEIEMLGPDEQARVENVGTAAHPKLKFYIPRGSKWMVGEGAPDNPNAAVAGANTDMYFDKTTGALYTYNNGWQFVIQLFTYGHYQELASLIQDLYSNLDTLGDNVSVLRSDYDAYVVATDADLQNLHRDVNANTSDIATNASDILQNKQGLSATNGRLDTIQAALPSDISVDNPLVNQNGLIDTVRNFAGIKRGTFSTWDAVPSDPNTYQPDSTGSTTPTNNDSIIVRDSATYHVDQIFDSSGNTEGYYINENGEPEPRANFAYTALLAIDHDYDHFVRLQTDLDNNTIVRVHAYDSTGTWLSQIIAVTAGTTPVDVVVAIPEDAKFLRVSYYESGSIDLSVFEAYGTYQFVYNGTWEENGKDGWHPWIQVSTTVFNADQLAAINSGITIEKVQQYDQSAFVRYTYDAENVTMLRQGQEFTNEQLLADVRAGVAILTLTEAYGGIVSELLPYYVIEYRGGTELHVVKFSTLTGTNGSYSIRVELLDDADSRDISVETTTFEETSNKVTSFGPNDSYTSTQLQNYYPSLGAVKDAIARVETVGYDIYFDEDNEALTIDLITNLSIAEETLF